MELDRFVAQAITYAADSGAKVINVSLGDAKGSQALTDAVKHALDKGALVFASVGNTGDRETGWSIRERPRASSVSVDLQTPVPPPQACTVSLPGATMSTWSPCWDVGTCCPLLSEAPTPTTPGVARILQPVSLIAGVSD
ncbi:S8 family serine peptidase [Streptomyces narbonensis]